MYALKNAYIEPNVDDRASISEPIIPEVNKTILNESINNVQIPSIEPIVTPNPVNNIQNEIEVPTIEIPVQTPEMNNNVNPFNVQQMTFESSPMLEPIVTPSVDNTVPVMDINIPPVEDPVLPGLNNDISVPVTPVTSSISKEDIFKEQKEAFMQACENMFDALVQKFEKELDNKN